MVLTEGVLDERFWSKVDKTEDCWNWTACISASGYGVFRMNYRNYRAHRLSYEQVNGDIPEGLSIDHLCMNKKCINPKHLEAVTPKENIHRYLKSIGFDRPGSSTERKCTDEQVRQVSSKNFVKAVKRSAELRSQKTHCIRGHNIEPNNINTRIIMTPSGKTKRKCMQCTRTRSLARYYKRKALA